METKQYSALPILGAVLLLCTHEEGRNDWLYKSLRSDTKAFEHKCSLALSTNQTSVTSIAETLGMRGLEGFRWLEGSLANTEHTRFSCSSQLHTTK